MGEASNTRVIKLARVFLISGRVSRGVVNGEFRRSAGDVLVGIALLGALPVAATAQGGMGRAGEAAAEGALAVAPEFNARRASRSRRS